LTLITVPEEFERRHGIWDKDRLQKEWSLWDSDTRIAYLFWHEIAKAVEEDPFLVANFAAAKACECRRIRGCGTCEVDFSMDFSLAEQTDLALMRTDSQQVE
jgi:hypothetical protein